MATHAPAPAHAPGGGHGGHEHHEAVGFLRELNAVVGEEFPFFADVGFRRSGLIDIEVVAPAGEFDTVVAHRFDKRGEVGEWQVGPLAGE